jgi:phosphonate transport system ATP-binding protein
MQLLIAYANSTGALLLLSVHNLDIARRYCTRTIALKSGNLIYDGPTDGISNSEMMESLDI